MRWSKIKNIIILLLVIVNGFLLALVGLRAWQTEQGERETRERMIGILANNGIEFLPQEVPGELKLPSWQVEVETPDEAQAVWLVGELRSVESVGGRTTYTGERGAASFSSDGGVQAEFPSNAWPCDRERITATAAEMLNALSVPSVQETGRREEENAVTVTYTQLWEGEPVFDRTLVLRWEDGSIRSLNGSCLLGGGEAQTGGETITSSTALARFLTALNDGGYVCSQITDVYAGYTSGGTGTVNLTPAWLIGTDVWPRQFVVDGVTGTVTAAE